MSDFYGKEEWKNPSSLFPPPSSFLPFPPSLPPHFIKEEIGKIASIWAECAQ